MNDDGSLSDYEPRSPDDRAGYFESRFGRRSPWGRNLEALGALIIVAIVAAGLLALVTPGAVRTAIDWGNSMLGGGTTSSTQHQPESATDEPATDEPATNEPATGD